MENPQIPEVKFRKFGTAFVLRLDTGERIVEAVAEFAKKNNVTAGFFYGVGTCRRAELGFFNWKTKKYSFKKLKGDFEIISLSGNISLLANQPVVHAHIVLGDREFRAWGGHLKEAEVLAVCEIFLTTLKGKLIREMFPQAGLNLLRLTRA